jgi:hypothetical protein
VAGALAQRFTPHWYSGNGFWLIETAVDGGASDPSDARMTAAAPTAVARPRLMARNLIAATIP